MHPNFSELCKILNNTFQNSKIITATNCQYKITDNFTSALKYLDLIYLSIDGYKIIMKNLENHLNGLS